jgi:surface antigen
MSGDAEARKPVLLATGLDEEDRRHADAAMSAALGPEGAGEAVTWDNPQSGSKGSFTPTEPAHQTPNGLCRAFAAEIFMPASPPRSVQGSACRDSAGKWSIQDIGPAGGI